MKISLIVFDSFDNYDLLATLLDQLKVTDVISGTSNGFKLLQRYTICRPDIKISIADGQKLKRAYNSIELADYILVITHKNGIKTKRSIEYAKKKNKMINIYEIE